MAWLRRSVRQGEDVAFEDVTEQWAVLGLMGPRSGDIAKALGLADITDLGFFRHGVSEFAGTAIRAARLSYVGEPGWEISMPAQVAPAFYRAVADQGVGPAGMFAQTSMRIEKGFLSYGHDLDTDINPMQAGLEFVISWGSDFTGRQALQSKRDIQPDSVMTTIILDDENANPIGNEPVYQEGVIVGKTTSAAFGYRVGKPVALALVDPGSLTASSVEVDIAGIRSTGSIRSGPAYP